MTRNLRRGLEAGCWSIALSCLLYVFAAHKQAHAAAHAVRVQTAAPDAPLGELRIPALGLAVPVLRDDGHTNLLRGVGHIPGTAMPGGLGTAGFAGHRDTFLRPLAGIRRRMEIDVSRGPASYRYQVDRTEVVRPEQVSVLDTQSTPGLVLVTCYPFHYIGAAPFRFIVYAHLVSLAPDAAVD